MGWVDGIITLVIVVSAGFGLFRGFVKEALSLIAWSIAFLVSLHFAADFAPQFESLLSNTSLQFAASFFCLFFATLAVAAGIGFGIRRIIEKGGASGGGNDRMAGFGFGVARGVVIVGGVLLALRPTSLVETEFWEDSILIQEINPVADWLEDIVPYREDLLESPAEHLRQIPGRMIDEADVLGAALLHKAQDDVESLSSESLENISELLETD